MKEKKSINQEPITNKEEETNSEIVGKIEAGESSKENVDVVNGYSKIITEKTPEKAIEVQKYELDKKYDLQLKKLEQSSEIIIGNSNLNAISMMAEKFSRAGDLVPKEFRGQPEKCFAAIYKGASIGLDAFTSLQRIAVVNGRATIWGDAALAVVRNTGELIHFREYFGVWVNKNDLSEDELKDPENSEMLKKFNGIIRKSAFLDTSNEKCGAACELKRLNGELILQFFTISDAKTAGLWNQNVWKTYPQRMIMYRARAYALRDAFPDVLEGLYLKEEIDGDNNFNKGSSEKIVNPPSEEEVEKINEAQNKLFKNADKKTN